MITANILDEKNDKNLYNNKSLLVLELLEVKKTVPFSDQLKDKIFKSNKDFNEHKESFT